MKVLEDEKEMEAYILKDRIVGFKIPQENLNFPQIFHNFFAENAQN